MKDRRLLMDDHASRYQPGSPYRPSNGSEGAMFYSRWCADCKRDAEYRETQENGCSILCNSMVFDVDEDGYPKEWIHGDDGQPKCTAFDDVSDRCDKTVDMFDGRAG